MKTAIIKIGLIISVLFFLCAATSWANDRKYNHNKQDGWTVFLGIQESEVHIRSKVHGTINMKPRSF